MFQNTIRNAALVCALAATAGAGDAWAKVDVVRDGGAVTYKFLVESVNFQPVSVDEQSFVKPSLVGVAGYEGIRYVEGEPELPVLRFFVEGDGAIEVIFDPALQKKSFHSGLRALPALPSAAKIPGAKRHLVLAKSAYEKDGAQPAAAFEITKVGTVRGAQRRLVTLYPVRYTPGTGRWELTPQITVKVAPSAKHAEAARPVMALLVGEKFWASPALAAYQSHKMVQGTRIEALAVHAGDTPEAIRAQLIALYQREPGLRSVLIVGDQADVPAKASDEISGVTDHFYRCVDTEDYAADVGTPDLGVGRLAVADEATLKIALDKIDAYARGNFQDTSWLRRITWIASDDPSYWQVAEGSFDYAIDHYTRDQQWTGSFPNAGELGGDKLYAITHSAETAQVLERMREGRGFINYGGHGSTDYWVAPFVGRDEVLALDHPEALPIVVANACITGAFNEDSFGETWLAHPKGAVAYWGSMDSTYWDEDDILQKALYDAIFRDGVYEFAKFTEYALGDVWRYYGGEGRSKYYWETYVSFADPTLLMRTKAPIVPAVVSTWDEAAHGYKHVVTAGGQALPGATVAVRNETTGEILFVGASAADGELVQQAAGPVSRGETWRVTVSGQDLQEKSELLESAAP